jgi:hypothetical protein
LFSCDFQESAKRAVALVDYMKSITAEQLRYCIYALRISGVANCPLNLQVVNLIEFQVNNLPHGYSAGKIAPFADLMNYPA